jgi:hypothetical protein
MDTENFLSLMLAGFIVVAIIGICAWYDHNRADDCRYHGGHVVTLRRDHLCMSPDNTIMWGW